MIQRALRSAVYNQANKFPFVAVTGPRQSGKTTLVRSLFDDYRYVNFEQFDLRSYANDDPKGFISEYSSKVILDEIQHVPELLSWLQVHSDERNVPGDYILTGSQNFSLMQQVSQSLAGRVAMFNLLPFSIDELNKADIVRDESWTELAFKGGYPRIYDFSIEPTNFYPSYEQTYIERDVRSIKNVGDLSTFRSFLKLLAGRTGKELNLSGIGSDIGVSYKTVQKWISVLEASFIVFRLPPFYKNFNKRIIKSPKIYFYDTGLLCHLLGITSASDLKIHFAKGELFENLAILEIMKHYLNRGIKKDLYYWKDSNHNEVDLLLEERDTINAIEIKSSSTFHSSFFKQLFNLGKVIPDLRKILLFGDNVSYVRNGVQLSSVFNITDHLP